MSIVVVPQYFMPMILNGFSVVYNLIKVIKDFKLKFLTHYTGFEFSVKHVEIRQPLIY